MSHPALTFRDDSPPGPDSGSDDLDPHEVFELAEDGRMGRQILDRLTGGEGGTK